MWVLFFSFQRWLPPCWWLRGENARETFLRLLRAVATTTTPKSPSTSSPRPPKARSHASRSTNLCQTCQCANSSTKTSPSGSAIRSKTRFRRKSLTTMSPFWSVSRSPTIRNLVDRLTDTFCRTRFHQACSSLICEKVKFQTMMWYKLFSKLTTSEFCWKYKC